MYKQKTKPTANSVLEFIECVENPKKREDAYKSFETPLLLTYVMFFLFLVVKLF